MTLQRKGTMLFVGAGRMGSALIAGLLRNGVAGDQVVVQDPAPGDDVQHHLSAHGVTLTSDAAETLTAPPAVVLLAVKPQALADVLPPLTRVIAKETLVVSVAAGKTLATLAAALPARQAIIRAMPNTPASAGAAMTVCVANSHASDAHRQWARTLFGNVGDVAWIEDETMMDGVTAVSGSGPAYVFLLAEALAAAGVKAGLDRALAERLARTTVSGAGRLLEQSEVSAAELRQAVTSPGGTTAAALDILNCDEALMKLVWEAVLAAKTRSQDLAD